MSLEKLKEEIKKREKAIKEIDSKTFRYTTQKRINTKTSKVRAQELSALGTFRRMYLTELQELKDELRRHTEEDNEEPVIRETESEEKSPTLLGPANSDIELSDEEANLMRFLAFGHTLRAKYKNQLLEAAYRIVEWAWENGLLDRVRVESKIIREQKEVVENGGREVYSETDGEQAGCGGEWFQDESTDSTDELYGGPEELDGNEVESTV